MLADMSSISETKTILSFSNREKMSYARSPRPLCSTTIGIKPELTVPTNTSTLNGLVDQNFASGGIPSAYLIADLAPNFSNGDPSQWRSVISYVPFYRRWHNMVAKPDFKTADLSIKWEDAQGVEFNFYIEPQGCFTIKFVFQERK